MGGLKHRTNLGNIKASGGKFYGKTRHEGKTYIGGGFSLADFETAYQACIMNRDGSLDPSFSIQGSGFVGGIGAALVQSDGKILVAGSFTSYNGTSTNRIARLNTDGSLDTSFSVGSGFNDTVEDIALQSDGKIVVVGYFTSYNGTSRNRIIRLNTDGSVDTSFSIGTGFNSLMFALTIQSDGKILTGGWSTSYNGTSRNRIFRLNTNGTIDTSFSIGSGFNSRVLSIAVDPDGKISVVGQFTSYNGTSANRIVRLNANGSRDTSFNIGTGAGSIVHLVSVQSDGKVLIGPYLGSYNGDTSVTHIARLNTNGSVDTNIGSLFSPPSVESFIVEPDDKILMVGFFTSYNGTSSKHVVRLNADTSLDTSLSTTTTGAGFNTFPSRAVLCPNGQYFVQGGFSGYNGTSVTRIVCVNTNGSLNTSFATGTGFNQYVRTIAVQSDGKVLIGGEFFNYNGTTANRIVRLNTNGSLDTSFSVGSGFSHPVWKIAVQSDGKILVGGQFYSYNGTNNTRQIIRLNANGSLDTSFSPGSGPTNGYYGVIDTAIQSDGKILAGGDFTSYNGTSINRIVRLNTNGSLDTSFSVGSGFNSNVEAIALQPDGKVLMGGGFSSYNGTSVNRIVRLNTDGSIDTSFSVGSGFNNYVYSIVVQSDGKVLAGGDFTSYNGTSINRIVRLNTNGSLDTSFSVGSGFNQYVRTIAIQSDGKILVGGSFASYNGNQFRGIVKLNIDGSFVNDLPEQFSNTVNDICYVIALE